MDCDFRRNRPPSAFTVLELLIATAVIGALIGLLLPALMYARESARRIQCMSNLREIGLAVQQFHDGSQKLPEAWTIASDKVSGYGWAVPLLPFLEQSNLSNRVNQSLPLSAAQNDIPRNMDLPIMRCPSDISDQMFDLFEEHSGHFSAQSHHGPVSLSSAPVTLIRLPSANYLGVFGTLEADESFPAPAGDGSIVASRAVCFADLERGQSHTLIIGERTAAVAPSTWFGVNFRGEDAACRLVGSAIAAPNCGSCDECEFGSRHAGGANFVWADGHVTLLPNEIDTREYQQLAKRRTH